MDRAIIYLSLHYFRLLTMSRSDVFRFRVLYPFVGMPHGEQGWRPPELFPSPPPMG